MSDIRTAIQGILDAEGDGWQVAQFVVCMGLERVTADGEIESSPWLWAPAGQPDWQTDGLLEASAELRQQVIDD